MNFDFILKELGEFGRWQKVTYMFLWLPVFAGGVHVLMYSFTGLEPKGFRCKIPECDDDNFGFSDYPEDVLFPETEDGEFDYCSYYSPSSTESSCSWNNRTITKHCSTSDSFAFEEFVMKTTIVTDWKLICDDSWKVSLIGTAYMFGLMIGSFICGVLSDVYGRRLVLIFAIASSSLGSLAGAFMPEYWSYLVTRVITAIGAEGVFLVPFTLSMEIVGVEEKVSFLPWVSYKTFLANCISIPFALGEAAVSGVASFARDWVTLQWTVSLVLCSHMVLWFIIPESPRWLIANKRTKEARSVIERAAKMNKSTVSESAFQPNVSSPGEVGVTEAPQPELRKYGLRDLFDPAVKKITLILFFNWPVTALVYFGLSMSMANLNENLIVSFVLSSLVEIPSYVFLVFLMDIWGRKPLFSSSLLLSGICCITAGAFLSEGSIGRTVLALLGKFGASAAFNISYMYTAELFPTCIRNSAVGVCSTIARLGAMSAPWVALYLPQVAPDWLSLVLYGTSALLGGILALLLPETLGSTLPDTFEDLEVIKKNSKSIFTCVRPWKESI